MAELAKSSALSKMKRLELPLGPFKFTIFQLRQGVGLKFSKAAPAKRQVKKHMTMLADAAGALGVHETDERYPEKHPKRNRHLWKLPLAQSETRVKEALGQIESIVRNNLGSMLNPDLQGTKLLVFPLFPPDISSVIDLKGRSGSVDVSRLGAIRVIDPSEISQFSNMSFFVLRKARRWWHGEAILFKAPQNEIRILLPFDLLEKVMKSMVGVLPQGSISLGTMRIKFRDDEVKALERGILLNGEDADPSIENRRKVAFFGLSSHMLLWPTGLKDKLLSENVSPDAARGGANADDARKTNKG